MEKPIVSLNVHEDDIEMILENMEIKATPENMQRAMEKVKRAYAAIMVPYSYEVLEELLCSIDEESR